MGAATAEDVGDLLALRPCVPAALDAELPRAAQADHGSLRGQDSLRRALRAAFCEGVDKGYGPILTVGCCGKPCDYREVALAEVAGAPASLVWVRPRKGERFEATLLPNGVIRLSSGVEHRSPSGAAMAVADVVSYDGWYGASHTGPFA
jgi:hypothetical protein